MPSLPKCSWARTTVHICFGIARIARGCLPVVYIGQPRTLTHLCMMEAMSARLEDIFSLLLMLQPQHADIRRMCPPPQYKTPSPCPSSLSSVLPCSLLPLLILLGAPAIHIGVCYVDSRPYALE